VFLAVIVLLEGVDEPVAKVVKPVRTTPPYHLE
jgi:hypothetical protein